MSAEQEREINQFDDEEKRKVGTSLARTKCSQQLLTGPLSCSHFKTEEEAKKERPEVGAGKAKEFKHKPW